MPDALTLIAATLGRDGYAFSHAPEMRAALEGISDWNGFASSWDRLGLDTYMADGGRYRKRRHAAFSAASGEAGLRRKPHQPHYQSRDHNALNGGVARWFEPVEDALADHPALRAILRGCTSVFDGLTDPATRPASWHVELHQFRIEARAGEAGQPTPEGLHRDGVDWVLVLLVRRENIASGETTIHDLARRPLGSFTLEQPLDAAWVDDGRVYHGVTPVEPVEAGRPAYRDVLVVTYRRE